MLTEDANIINNSFEKYFKSEDCPEGILNKSTKYSLTAGEYGGADASRAEKS